MRKLLINIVLFWVAVALLITIGIYGLFFGFFHTLLKKGSWIKFWGDTLYQINVGIDQIGNVMLSVFLNKYALIRSTYYPFGKVNHTISHVLAVNYLIHNNVTGFGKWIINLLEFIDPGHMRYSL